MAFSDRLRQPDNLSRTEVSQKLFDSRPERLTALRPYLAAGLPLSCAIIALQKITAIVIADSGRLRLNNICLYLSSFYFPRWMG
jgi:hypothetical protein